MPCSHASGTGENSSIERRDFMRSALMIGGTSALSTAMSVAGLSGVAQAGRLSAADRLNRQHAWAAFLDEDPRGLAAPPAHHVVLFLDYLGDGEPTAADRAEMERALRQLEDAFEWSNEGLLFTVNYSLDYFDRFDENLPTGVDLRDDQAVIDAITEPGDPNPETFEVMIDLASDNAANILAAEEALWGNVDEIDGVDIEHTFEGIFAKPTSFPGRRTGFVGPGEPATHINSDDFGDAHDLDEPDSEDRDLPIPEDAPLSMGFQSVFSDNVPTETDVSLLHDQTLTGLFEEPGQFAQGTIQHASKLRIDLDDWYQQNDLEGRMARMFSPHHDPDDFGEIGNNQLTSGPAGEDLVMRDRDADTDVARLTEQDAAGEGVVGHSQKLARARFDLSERDTDGESDDTLDTTILRRDFNTTDVTDADEASGLHFLALMRFNGYMVYVRNAMSGVDFDASEQIAGVEDGGPLDIEHSGDVPQENDGFLEFVTATRRGNFLMPPITLRSLPRPRAVAADVDTKDDEINTDSNVKVIVDGVDPDEVDAETARFGPIADVNQARGATPEQVKRKDVDGDGDDELRFKFEMEGFETGEQTAKFRAKTVDGAELQGTTTIIVE